MESARITLPHRYEETSNLMESKVKHAILRSPSLVFPMATAYKPVFLNQGSS